MAGTSKYEAMQNSVAKQIEAIDAGVEDKIKEKRLQAKLAGIDEETKQEIKEIKELKKI